jgi:hypothetical protein
MPRLLFLFLDGVGLGEEDPARNPLGAARTPSLDRLLQGRIDPHLDEGDLVGLPPVERREDAFFGGHGEKSEILISKFETKPKS